VVAFPATHIAPQQQEPQAAHGISQRAPEARGQYECGLSTSPCQIEVLGKGQEKGSGKPDDALGCRNTTTGKNNPNASRHGFFDKEVIFRGRKDLFFFSCGV
jgi:hypothetical protein